MKKKGLTFILFLSLVLVLTGCTENSSPNKVDSSDTKNKVEDIEDNSVEYKSVNFKDKIKTDFVEITLTKAKTGKEIKPDKPKSVYRYHQKQDGKTYFYVYGNIKNVSGKKFEFADNMYVLFSFDDKYEYGGYVSADESGTFSYIYAYLDPLEKEKFYLIAAVPNEVIKTYKNVELKFGFKENFEHEYNIQEKDCDYLYSIKMSK